MRQGCQYALDNETRRFFGKIDIGHAADVPDYSGSVPDKNIGKADEHARVIEPCGEHVRPCSSDQADEPEIGTKHAEGTMDAEVFHRDAERDDRCADRITFSERL